MKFIVDELPYYEEFCPLYPMCWDNANDYKCPRYWDKDKVCSNDNPHECQFLIETSKNMNAGMTISKSQELYPDAPLAPIIKL